MPKSTALVSALLVALALLPAGLSAQKVTQKSKSNPVTTTLPAMLSAFLADSAVKTRGLPWGVSSELPVAWTTTKPTPPSFNIGQGITMQHEGMVQVQATDTSAAEMNLNVYGNEAGIQRVVIFWDMALLSGEGAEGLLTAAGWQLRPLKCSRDTEGYSYGNLLYAAKAPGKTGSGLQESWNCAHDGCTVAMTIYYRKSDVEQFDCAGA